MLYESLILHLTPPPLSIIHDLALTVEEDPFTVKIASTKLSLVFLPSCELHNTLAVELEVVKRPEISVVIGVSYLYIAY